MPVTLGGQLDHRQPGALTQVAQPLSDGFASG